MAHDIDFSTGEAAMAFKGEVPWHGLGHSMGNDESLDEWQRKAGLDFTIQELPVFAKFPDGELVQAESRKALARSDTGTVLHVPTVKYQVVQPREVFDFFRTAVAENGYEMETAGALKGGQYFWALAKTHRAVDVTGSGDVLEQRVLLATAVNGAFATTATETSVRVVCQNTLNYALGMLDDGCYRISHLGKFDADEARRRVKLTKATAWEEYVLRIREMAKVRLTDEQAAKYFVNLLAKKASDGKVELTPPVEKAVAQLLDNMRHSPGADKAGATLWGALNAVTFREDHQRRERSASNRMFNTMFSDSKKRKDDAFRAASSLIAA